jgi:hypothetical protein
MKLLVQASTPLSLTICRHPELVSGSELQMLKQVQHDFDISTLRLAFPFLSS